MVKEFLTSNLRTGIIRLLRKGQKDPTLTGNYRPISLLSIHYKLASCCITQRLRPLVSKVIGQQQKAYIEGNIIGSCIVNILNLMKHANRKQMESLILLIDFKKAFDSLTHRYIENCLKMFNFFLIGNIVDKCTANTCLLSLIAQITPNKPINGCSL